MRDLVRGTITTPVFLVTHLVRSHRIERSVEHVAEFSEPMPRPASIAERGVQSAPDGTGPIVMRVYSIVIEHSASSPSAADRVIGFLLPKLIDQRTAELIRVLTP